MFLLVFAIYYFTNSNSRFNINTRLTVMKYIKYSTLISLGVSLINHLCTIYYFILYSNLLNSSYAANTPIFLPSFKSKYIIFFFNFYTDFFGLILILLAYLVGFISLYVLDTRLHYKNLKYLFSFNLFVIIVYLYATTTNIVLFFIYYELLLLPSFLFVYYTTSSRRAVQASIYFIVWTQIGSLIVLLAIIFILSITGTSDFSIIRSYSFSNFESYVIYTLVFAGFGVKVPIWPFHYWLTKTHVEAPSGFSIYLSGFLVKTAVYGFYKIISLISVYINSTFFITICILGVIDSSLKMWGQTDLKKLVAYGTIQEMNIIYLVFCWGDSTVIGAGILFCVTHAFLSGLMFYLVDCIYRRYHTRSIIEINGILQFNPNLAIAIILMLIFFAGLPGTLKFTVEFYIFSALMSVSPVFTLMLMFIANVIGLIGFSKCWFNSIFGINKKNLYRPVVDLSVKELYVLFICFFFLFILSFITSVVK